jgi:hypothetical protein
VIVLPDVPNPRVFVVAVKQSAAVAGIADECVEAGASENEKAIVAILVGRVLLNLFRFDW